MNSGTRLALLLVVSVGGWISFPRARATVEQWIESQRSERNLTDAVRSTAYTLRDHQWLDFAIPPHATSIRVLTNASVRTTKVPPSSLTTPRHGWRYVVDYQMLRGAQRTVDQRRYHLRTSVPQTIDPETGLVQVLTWFRESDRLPTRACTIPLKLEQLEPRPDRLRLKLGSWDRDLGDVVVRVYICHERDNYQQPYAWGRMSEANRMRTCRASVYPPDLLSPQERVNFLRWNWSALSPLGHDGVDYHQQRLYQRDGIDVAMDRHTNRSPTTICTAQRPRMFTLPAIPGSVVIRAESLEAEASSARSLHLVTRIHQQPRVTNADQGSRESLPSSPWSLTSQDTLEATWDAELPVELAEVCTFPAVGGLLEIVPSESVSCDVRWFPADPDQWAATMGTTMPLDDDGAVVLPPAESSARAYVVDANRSLEYAVTHVGGHPTPLRVHLWQIMSDAATLPSAAPQTVHLTGFNRLDHAVMEVDLPVPTVVSVWDHARAGSVTSNVSETGIYYLQLPEQLASLRVTASSGPYAVSLATRPWDLPRTFQIVAETQRVLPTESEDGQTWFVVQPNDFAKRIDDNQSVDIGLAQRPPIVNPMLQEGTYEWRDFLPQGSWIGRYVLAPRDASRAVREDAWGSTFCELAIGRPLSLQWHAPSGSTSVVSRLAYDGAQPDQGAVRLRLNGKVWKEFEPRAERGEIDLPLWDLAKHGATAELAVEAPPGLRLFMSAIETTDALPTFSKLLVHEITSDGSSFELEKRSTERESWMIRSFAVLPTDANLSKDAYTLEAQLESVPPPNTQPTTSWTLRTRRFVITPNATQETLLLGGTTQRADDGLRCVFSLGADTPPGKYRITIRRTDALGYPVLMSLYQLLPSTVDQFEMNRVVETQP